MRHYKHQPDNFLRIAPFTGAEDDNELKELMPFLIELANADTVRPVHTKYLAFQKAANRNSEKLMTAPVHRISDPQPTKPERKSHELPIKGNELQIKGRPSDDVTKTSESSKSLAIKPEKIPLSPSKGSNKITQNKDIDDDLLETDELPGDKEIIAKEEVPRMFGQTKPDFGLPRRVLSMEPDMSMESLQLRDFHSEPRVGP